MADSKTTTRIDDFDRIELDDAVNCAEEAIGALHALASRVCEPAQPKDRRPMIDAAVVLILSETAKDHIERAVEAVKPLFSTEG